MAITSGVIYDLLINVEKRVSAFAVGRRLKRTRAAAHLYGRLYRFFRPAGSVSISSWGHTLHVDPGDLGIARCLIVYNGVWEALQTDTFLSILKEGMVVLDIGANVGYYTLLAARAVGPQGKVFAFEPEPKNYGLLCSNVKENGYDNVITVPSALSDHNGTGRLYLSPNNSGIHNLSKRWEETTFINVNTVTLDEYFRDYERRIDVIKLDAEGAEELIFKGMSQLLKNNPNLILFTELNPASDVYSPEGYIQKLIASGFRIFELVEEEHSVRAIGRERLSRLTQSLHDPKIPETHSDLVCVRGHWPDKLSWMSSGSSTEMMRDADVLSAS
jgi:FkbM family methyltransferase